MSEYGSHQYWNTRFKQNDAPFDWLQPPNFVRDVVTYWMEPDSLEHSQILHLGCGTSKTSDVLRDLVDSPGQIHNVDFSQAAIDAASRREKQRWNNNPNAKDPEDQQEPVDFTRSVETMRWSCLDLLSLTSTIQLMEQQMEVGNLFDMILDKSTSDSISLLPPVSVELPYALSVNGWTSGIRQSMVTQTAEIHPLHLLAVHLAALSTPGIGKWIVISYSEDRFPFLPNSAQTTSQGLLPSSVVQAGFPHPSELWRLEAKESIELNVDQESLASRKKRLSSGFVHRPVLSHWLYVLVRTDTLVM